MNTITVYRTRAHNRWSIEKYCFSLGEEVQVKIEGHKFTPATIKNFKHGCAVVKFGDGGTATVKKERLFKK